MEKAEDYLGRGVAETAPPNGVLGAKVMLDADTAETSGRLRERLGEPDASDAEATRRAFPDPKPVYLTRRDKVAQAVSYYVPLPRGAVGGVAALPGAEPEPETDAAVDYSAAHTQVQTLAPREARWQAFSATSKPVPRRPSTKTLCGSPTARSGASWRFLGLEPPPGWSLPHLGMERLANETSRRWAERHLEAQPVRF